MKGRLRAEAFRNLQIDVELSHTPVVLVGPNAAGKTSLLEAIYYLGHGRSFRTRNWRALIRWSAHEARVVLERLEEGDRIEAVLGQNRIFLYQSRTVRFSEWAPKFPVLYMGERTWELFSLEPKWRRRLLDQSLALLHPEYQVIRLQYYRAWRSRNRILKQRPLDRVQMESWNEQFIKAAVRVWKQRRAFLARMAPEWSQAWRQMFQDLNVRLEYRYGGMRDAKRPPDENPEQLRAWVENQREEEVQRGMSLLGPHRDDVVARTGHGSFWDEASAGQVRSFLMAWALALERLVRKERNVRAVLLFDDFDAELDRNRVRQLFHLLQDHSAFLTTSRIEAIDGVSGAQVLRMQDGKIV